MKYSKLKSLLENLEGQVKVPTPPDPISVRPRIFPIPIGVRCPIQVFALHLEEMDETLPIVVSVGANYTQGTNSCPRDIDPKSPGVVQGLQGEKTKLHGGLEAYRKDPVNWYKYSLASSPSLLTNYDKNYDFHLVMTNFCAWITDDYWQDVETCLRANLLVSNPPFNGNTSTSDWLHLDALADALEEKKQPVLWVGHGMGSEVFALFRLWVEKRKIDKWILLPNLSTYPYDYIKQLNKLKRYEKGDLYRNTKKMQRRIDD